MPKIVFMDNTKEVLDNQKDEFFTMLRKHEITVDVPNSTIILEGNGKSYSFSLEHRLINLPDDFMTLQADKQKTIVKKNIASDDTNVLYVIDLCLDRDEAVVDTGCIFGKNIISLNNERVGVLYTSSHAQFVNPDNLYGIDKGLAYVPRAIRPDNTFDMNFPAGKICQLYFWGNINFGEPTDSIIKKMLSSYDLNEQYFGAVITQALRLAYE